MGTGLWRQRRSASAAGRCTGNFTLIIWKGFDRPFNRGPSSRGARNPREKKPEAYFMIRLQEWIHRFEVGEGTRTVRLGVVFIALLGLTAVYELGEYGNFFTAGALDAAPLVRNLAAGACYTSGF